MARTLSEVKDVLQSYETAALADVAATLAEVAESLARTARDLRETSREEWMDAEAAAAYLKRTPKAFEKVVAKGEIPKHYLTERLAFTTLLPSYLFPANYRILDKLPEKDSNLH